MEKGREEEEKGMGEKWVTRGKNGEYEKGRNKWINRGRGEKMKEEMDDKIKKEEE